MSVMSMHRYASWIRNAPAQSGIHSDVIRCWRQLLTVAGAAEGASRTAEGAAVDLFLATRPVELVKTVIFPR